MGESQQKYRKNGGTFKSPFVNPNSNNWFRQKS
jgi:hypothetical protein